MAAIQGPGLGWNNDYVWQNPQGQFAGVRNTPQPGRSYPSQQGQVLGANTAAAPASNPQPQGQSQPSAPSEPDYSQQISEMYEPYKAELSGMEGDVNRGYSADVENLNKEVTTRSGQYEVEGQNLIQDTNTEETKFNKTLQSALNDAVRAFNALRQQSSARFGGGSSAGQAVGELASQEFYRQQGQVGEKGVEGSLQFATERTRIGQYVQKKKDDLDLYKSQALAELKKNLDASLREIGMRKADIEANKTRDRLAVLQSTIEQARQISLADRQFRQNLGLAAVSKLQEVSGRQFTPQEWNEYINQFMGEFSQRETPTQVGAGAPQGVATAVKPSYNPRSGKDEFQYLA